MAVEAPSSLSAVVTRLGGGWGRCVVLVARVLPGGLAVRLVSFVDGVSWSPPLSPYVV